MPELMNHFDDMDFSVDMVSRRRFSCGDGGATTGMSVDGLLLARRGLLLLIIYSVR